MKREYFLQMIIGKRCQEASVSSFEMLDIKRQSLLLTVLLVLFIMSLVFTTGHAYGAVTYDTGNPITQNISTNPRNSVTFAHTVGTCADRLLVVIVNTRADETVTSVTYGGAALTSVVTANGIPGSGQRVEIFRRINPTNGSANVVVTYSANTSTADGVFALNYCGVDQTTPVGASGGNTNPSTNNLLVTLSTLSANSVIVGGANGHGGDMDPWTETGSTNAVNERYDVATGTSTFSDDAYAGGDMPTTATGSYTLRFNSSVTDNIAVAAVELVPSVPITTVGDGTNPGNATVAPGTAITDLDSFTLQTSSGTDSVTALTVTLAAGTAAGLSEIRITNNAGTTTYFSAVVNPASDTVNFSGGTPIPVTTTSTQFKVRITPRTHANMLVPPGASYAVTGTVMLITSTNTKVYNDTASATITIDNLSPANATWGTITPGNTQIILNWTNPGDADFSQVVILRKTSTITDTPVEGATYIQGNSIGTSTVRYVGALATFTDTGLTNGTNYYYKIFARDANGNYSANGVETGPHVPTAVVTLTVGDGISPSDKNVATSSTNNAVSTFTFQASSGSHTVTQIVVTRGGSGAAADVSSVKIYRDNNNDNEWDGGDVLIGSSTFSGMTATFSSLSVTVTTTSVKYLITYDIAAGATGGNTLNGYVSSATTATATVVNNDNADATLTITTGGCIRTNPTVEVVPGTRVIAKGTSVTYSVRVTNNDSSGCSSTSFTLSKAEAPAIPNANFSASALTSSVTGALTPGTVWTTVLTHTAAAGAANGSTQQTTVSTLASANGHAITAGNQVTTTVGGTALGTGDGTLLKRAPEETCHSCHKTQANRTIASPDWADAIKYHSSDWQGTCLNPAHTDKFACQNASSTWTPANWNGGGTTGWGYSTAAASKYGQFVCTTCHTAHDTTNIYLIKQTIRTPDGTNWASTGTQNVTIDFRNKTGTAGVTPGTMGDDTGGHATSTKVCEACHSQSNYHRYNQAANPNHFNAQDCSGCHSHKTGFAAGESKGNANCSPCHGTIWTNMITTSTKVSKHTLGNVAGTNDSFNDTTQSWGANLGSVAAANRSCVNMCHKDHIHNQPGGSNHSYNAHQNASTQANRSVTRNPDRTIATGTPANTDFNNAVAGGGMCLSCHTNAVAAGRPALSQANYNLSAHNSTSTTPGGAWTYTLHDSSLFNRNCTKCHSSRTEGTTPNFTTIPFTAVHFSDYPRLLAGRTNPNGVATEFVCYNCHGTAGTGANYSNKNLVAEFAKTYKHNVNADSNHDTNFEAAAVANLGLQHVNCLDCHNPHVATSAKKTPRPTGTPVTATGNDVSGVLQGVTGVSVTFSGTNWTAPTGYAITASAADEYQICFRCHSGANSNWSSWGGSGAAAWTNVGLEFSPNNRSAHPIVTGLSNYPNSINPKALTTGQMLAPWNTNVGTQTMMCSDCHNTDNTSAGVQGPHGSGVKWMLAGTNKAWPYTTTAGNGGSSGTFWTYATRSSGAANGLFCMNCHNLNTQVHNRTAPHSSAPCVNCHIRVPHGGKVSRLISTDTAGLPGRYRPNGAGGAFTGGRNLSFTKANGVGSYGTGNCRQTGCNDHSASASESW